MKNLFILLGLIGIMSCGCIQIDRTKIQKSDKKLLDKTRIDGVKDLDEALKSAKESNKNILIVFYADWCDPCRRMERETLSAPAVKEAMKNYIFFHVNVDAEHSADKYKGTSIPRSVIVDKEGSPKSIKEGFMNRIEMVRFLKQSFVPVPQ